MIPKGANIILIYCLINFTLFVFILEYLDLILIISILLWFYSDLFWLFPDPAHVAWFFIRFVCWNVIFNENQIIFNENQVIFVENQVMLFKNEVILFKCNYIVRKSIHFNPPHTPITQRVALFVLLLQHNQDKNQQ